jgi:hypothetical protein
MSLIILAANFDPEFFTSYEKKLNNLLTNSLVQNNITWANQLTIFPSPHENIEMDGIQKLGITLGLGLFIMTLALFNVSFLTKDFG